MLEDAPLVVAEGADVLRTTTIRLAAGAVAIVRDIVILGRAGEGPGRLESLLRAEGPDGVILHDALRVEPATWAQDAYVALAPGHRAIGTVAVLGAPGEIADGRVRAAGASVRGGATARRRERRGRRDGAAGANGAAARTATRLQRRRRPRRGRSLWRVSAASAADVEAQLLAVR